MLAWLVRYDMVNIRYDMVNNQEEIQMDLENKSQPSESQIREFWKRLDFKFSPKTQDIKFGGEPQSKYSIANHWIYPDSSYHKTLPPMNLTSLFKHAIPKLEAYSMDNRPHNGHYVYYVWVTLGLKTGKAINFDPVLALFWAIWAVIE